MEDRRLPAVDKSIVGRSRVFLSVRMRPKPIDKAGGGQGPLSRESGHGSSVYHPLRGGYPEPDDYLLAF